ncbi:MAG: Crp/Fnr family transcriptional regulator [Pseudomonadota bacterium]
MNTPTDIPEACANCAIRNRGVCAHLYAEELTKLDSLSRRRRYRPGETIVMEGSRGVVGNVIDGTLVERKTMADGREQIVSLLFSADFLGTPLSDQADATVDAVSDVMLCTFDRDQFDAAAAEMPGLSTALHEQARAELVLAREWMLLLGQKRAIERIATFLLRLANRRRNVTCLHKFDHLTCDADTLTIPISRRQIADFLGLTTETVSRKFGELRDLGVIDIADARHITVHSLPRLRAAAGFVD